MISQEVIAWRPGKQLAKEKVVELAGRAKPHPCMQPAANRESALTTEGTQGETSRFHIVPPQRNQPITLVMLNVVGDGHRQFPPQGCLVLSNCFSSPKLSTRIIFYSVEM